jgi:hypothetical protein
MTNKRLNESVVERSSSLLLGVVDTRSRYRASPGQVVFMTVFPVRCDHATSATAERSSFASNGFESLQFATRSRKSRAHRNLVSICRAVCDRLRCVHSGDPLVAGQRGHRAGGAREPDAERDDDPR